jgi:hypothetical protein
MEGPLLLKKYGKIYIFGIIATSKLLYKENKIDQIRKDVISKMNLEEIGWEERRLD